MGFLYSPSYRLGTNNGGCRFNRTCYNNATASFIAYDDLMTAQTGMPPRKVEQPLLTSIPFQFEIADASHFHYSPSCAVIRCSSALKRKGSRGQTAAATASSIVSAVPDNDGHHPLISAPANQRHKSQATQPCLAPHTIERVNINAYATIAMFPHLVSLLKYSASSALGIARRVRSTRRPAPKSTTPKPVGLAHAGRIKPSTFFCL